MQKRVAVGIQFLGLILGVFCFATHGWWAWQADKMRDIIRAKQQNRADQFVEQTRQKLKGEQAAKKRGDADAIGVSRMSNPELERAQSNLFRIARNQQRYGWTLIGVGVVGLCLAVVGMVLGRRARRASPKGGDLLR